MSHSRRYIIVKARVTAAIAVVLSLSAALAFPSAPVAQMVPSQPSLPPQLGPLADLFPGIESLFPGTGTPGSGIQSNVSCAPADEQQHDCGQGSDVGEDISIDIDRDRDGGSASVRGATRLVLSVRPRSDRSLPLRFRLSGRLVPPKGLVSLAELFRTLGVDVRAQACNGRVTITFKARGRTIARRRASVTSTCRFRTGVTIRTRRRLGRARRLRASARYGGNRFVGPVRRSLKLRIR
jgi:hypothetical protein